VNREEDTAMWARDQLCSRFKSCVSLLCTPSLLCNPQADADQQAHDLGIPPIWLFSLDWERSVEKHYGATVIRGSAKGASLEFDAVPLPHI
jgi:hypothetical protein